MSCTATASSRIGESHSAQMTLVEGGRFSRNTSRPVVVVVAVVVVVVVVVV